MIPGGSFFMPMFCNNFRQDTRCCDFGLDKHKMYCYYAALKKDEAPGWTGILRMGGTGKEGCGVF